MFGIIPPIISKSDSCIQKKRICMTKLKQFSNKILSPISFIGFYTFWSVIICITFTLHFPIFIKGWSMIKNFCCIVRLSNKYTSPIVQIMQSIKNFKTLKSSHLGPLSIYSAKTLQVSIVFSYEGNSHSKKKKQSHNK